MIRGEREWWITIPAEGAPPLNGAAPALIEWRRPPHSAAFDLPDAGCVPAAFEIRHPEPARLRALLAGLGLADVATIVRGTPALSAVIETPAGRRVLGGFDQRPLSTNACGSRVRKPRLQSLPAVTHGSADRSQSVRCGFSESFAASATHRTRWPRLVRGQRLAASDPQWSRQARRAANRVA